MNFNGRSYTEAGSTNSDFLIKTKGCVKIQWGHKFIDLIKDGKICGQSDEIINTVNSPDDISNKTGIYYCSSDLSLWVNVSGIKLNLLGEGGTQFVSFLDILETTPDLKLTALNNIGFIYSSYKDAVNSGLTNGIVYCEQDKKLYTISNGQFEQYTIEQQVIPGDILLSSTALIKYDDGFIRIIDNDTSIIDASLNGVTINTDLKVNKVFTEFLSSSSGSFKLYNSGGKSVLEVDNIIVRDTVPDKKDEIDYYPEYRITNRNVISEQNGDELTLGYKHQYKVGDILYVWVRPNDLTPLIIKKFYFQVKSVNDLIIICQKDSNLNIDEDVLNKEVGNFNLVDKMIFTEKAINNDIKTNIIIENQTVRTLESKDLFGKITYDIPDIPTVDVGIYSENFIGDNSILVNSKQYGTVFKKRASDPLPKYSPEVEVPFDDYSQTIPTTKWVKDHIPIDNALSFTSENPVWNKTVTEELAKKLEQNDVTVGFGLHVDYDGLRKVLLSVSRETHYDKSEIDELFEKLKEEKIKPLEEFKKKQEEENNPKYDDYETYINNLLNRVADLESSLSSLQSTVADINSCTCSND